MASESSFKSFAEVLKEEKSRVLHQPEHGGRPLTALCFSGGGIRSATFNLGLIQALAKRGLLDKFDYLSTVSGGGYIGAWLTTWAHNSKGGMAEVQGVLARPAPAAEDREGRPEPRQLHHLRNYSNYLTPRLGIASGDGLGAVAIWLRNLLLNGLQIWPWLIALFLLPLVAGRLGFWLPAPASAAPGHFVLGLGTILLLVALVSQLSRLTFESAAPVAAEPVSPLRSRSLAPFYTIPMTAAMGCLLLGWVLLLTARARDSVHWLLRDHGLPIFAILFLLFLLATGLAALVRKPGVGALPPGLRPALLGLAAAVASAAIESQLIYVVLTFDPLWRWSGALTGSGDGAQILGAVATWAAPPPLPDGAVVADSDDAWKSLLLFLVGALPIFLALQVAANWVFTGSTSRILNDASREWLARADGIQMGIAAVLAGWLAISFGSPLLFDWLIGNFTVRSAPWTWVATALGPVVSVIGVWFAQSSRTAGAADGNASTRRKTFKDKAIAAVGALSLPLAVVLILATLAYAGYTLANAAVPDAPGVAAPRAVAVNPREMLPHEGSASSDPLCTPEWTEIHCVTNAVTLRQWLAAKHAPWPEALVCLALVLAGWFAGSIFNVNRYSLFGFYRERLARAYLGGGRTDRRQPDPFTHFDPKDNYPFALALQRPLHVVNAAINLGGSGDLSWQERRAMSFTFSPLYSGAADLEIRGTTVRGAFRPSADYTQGVTLAGAVAISGAAANPNMGYHHSPAISFLLSLCNVRLGAWLGNPAGNQAWKRKHPGNWKKPSGVFMLQEAVGKLSSWSSWLNLSDGGHFENLGLYEMARRGCKLIVLGDGSADPEGNYDDLGRAMRLLRTDFGIEFEELVEDGIPVPPTAPLPPEQRAAHRRWRLFRLHYPAGFETPGTVEWEHSAGGNCDRHGYLLYFKTVRLGDEPQDVGYYASTAPDFPHESTGDQFFSESQFEAYRKLGEWTLARAGGGDGVDDTAFRHFIQALEKAGTMRT